MTPGVGVLLLGCGHIILIKKLTTAKHTSDNLSMVYTSSNDEQGRVYQNC